MKGVFDLASNLTQQLFVRNSLCRELLSLAVTFRSRISYSFRICSIALFHTEISGITDYFPVIGAAQLIGFCHIVNISRSRYHRVDDSCGFVHTNVHLHSEVPVVAFLRRMHFRIALFVGVFRRTRRFNKRAVNIRALAEEQTSISKLLLEQIKDLFVQAVFLREMTEAQNRSLIGTF